MLGRAFDQHHSPGYIQWVLGGGRWRLRTQKLTATVRGNRQSWGNELEVLELSHIGVTPTRGADTPAYSPYQVQSAW